MLFDPNIEPSCSYCRHGFDMGRNEVACEKFGVVNGSGYCRAFKYESTKRVPQVMSGFISSSFSDEDFAL